MQPPKTYPGLVHCDGNLICAVDVETTGTLAGYHEIIQIAVVPLDGNLSPMQGVSPFYFDIKPNYPERADPEAMRVHGIKMSDLETKLSDSKVADLFDDWFRGLKLPFRKSIMPLAHNWAFEKSMLVAWLGMEGFGRYFHAYARDSMLYAISLMDKSSMIGAELPFNSVRLGALCKKFGVELEQAHDALADCLAEAQVYRHLLKLDVY